MTDTNSEGHSTTSNSRVGFPLVHPQAVNISHPPLRAASCSVLSGRALQLQPWIVLPPKLYQSPQTDDAALEMMVSLWPQMFAREYWRLSYPGTAMSMCALSQPVAHGGQRFFFITTAFQSLLTAEGLVTSRHLPHPPMSAEQPTYKENRIHYHEPKKRRSCCSWTAVRGLWIVPCLLLFKKKQDSNPGM